MVRTRDLQRRTIMKMSEESQAKPSSKGRYENSASFKLLLLTLMVLQNSSVVLVGRYTRASVSIEDSYVVNHLILVAEFMKCVLSCVLESYTSSSTFSSSFQTHIISNPLDFLKILIPALLYLLQNSLLYVALSNLSAPLFQVTYQSKLLTTALVSVFLLARRYTLQQWICLFSLAMGVAMVVLAEKKDTDNSSSDSQTKQDFGLGLISVTIACFSSAFAGVYFEKVVKSKAKTNPSVWMRNIQLAFFSVVIALGQYMTAKEDKPFMHGFNKWVWVVVLLQAAGGLLVAAVIKYADNVLKGLATGVSVVFSTVCSVFFFGTVLTSSFYWGAGMILLSVYVFSNPINFGKKDEVKNEIEMTAEEKKELVLPK